MSARWMQGDLLFHISWEYFLKVSSTVTTFKMNFETKSEVVNRIKNIFLIGWLHNIN